MNSDKSEIVKSVGTLPQSTLLTLAVVALALGNLYLVHVNLRGIREDFDLISKSIGANADVLQASVESEQKVAAAIEKMAAQGEKKTAAVIAYVEAVREQTK